MKHVKLDLSEFVGMHTPLFWANHDLEWSNDFFERTHTLDYAVNAHVGAIQGGVDEWLLDLWEIAREVENEAC